FENRVNQFLDSFPDALKTFDTLITGSTIWQNRTMGIGVIDKEEGISWGLTGPCLRGSGVEIDLRLHNPYSGYETYDFDIPTETDGDVWSRFLVRMRELRESYKFVRQAMERLKPGPVKADAPKLVLPDRDYMRKHMDSLIHHFL